MKLKEILNQILIPVLQQNSIEKKELVYKCPFHEDKPENPKHGHFYINLDTLNYYCFYCNQKGKNVLKLLNYILSSPNINNFNIKKLSQEEIQQLRTEINLLYINEFNYLLSENTIITNNGLNAENIEKIRKEIINQYLVSKGQILYNNKIIQNKSIFKEIIDYLVRKRNFSMNYIKKLITKQIIIPFYSDCPVYISPQFSKRQIDQGIFLIFDGHQMNKQEFSDVIFFQKRDIRQDQTNKRKKYITITLNPFLRKYLIPSHVFFTNLFSFDCNQTKQIKTIFIVEGIFDLLKLNFLFEEQQFQDQLIVQTLGKNINKEIVDLLLKKFNPISLIYQPDKDVQDDEKKKVALNLLNWVNNQQKVLVQIQTQFKDWGEMKTVKDLKTVKIEQQEFYITGISDFIELFNIQLGE